MAVALPLQSLLLSILLSLQGGLVLCICPSLGDVREDARSSQGGGIRLLLDLGRPAQCSGTVTAWRYCAYRRQSASVLLVAFQRESDDSAIYQPIKESVRFVSLNRTDFEGQDFMCRTLNLTMIEQFSVERNAVIGACLPTNRRLLLTSTLPSTNVENVYRVDDDVYDDCPVSAFTNGQSININDNNPPINQANVILHLEAQITPSLDPTQCLVGSNPIPTAPSSQAGMFLDILHPAPCSGLLATWNYCYYSDTSTTVPGNYSVDVGVWFYSSLIGGYSLVPLSRVTISINIIRQGVSRSPTITCGTQATTAVIKVGKGDVVGAIIDGSSSMILPLLGTSDDGGDYLLKLNALQNVTARLHLSANVRVLAAGSTVIGNIPPVSGGVNGVAVAVGVVIVVLVLLVAATVATMLCLFLRKRRMNRTEFKSYGDSNSGLSRGLHDSSVKESIQYPSSYQQNAPENPPTRPSSKAPPPRPTLPTRLMKPKGPPPRPVHKTLSAPLQTENNSPRSTANKSSTLSRSPEYAELSKIYPDGKEDAKYAMLLQQNVEKDVYGNIPHYMLPATDRNSLYAQLKSMKTKSIKKDTIRVTGHLGSGQFGNVEKGEWLNGTKKVPVALKTLNKGTSLENMVKFLQEAAIMAQFKHPNVINLYGVVSQEEEPVLVVEFADGGDLKQHLDSLRPSVTDDSMLETSQLLLRFSQQIAFGMQYLSRKGFIHRDLAARNILVFGTKICKIADFGMSRDLPMDGVYVSSGGMIPLKWTALEAIHYKEFSTASDVWSYGCVLYEIWSLGHKPFEFEEIGQKVIRLLRSGVRLPPPPGCPKAIYTIMIHSWHPDPDARPSFRNIVVDLVDSRGQKNTLYIPEEDLDSHEDAGRLGADLQAGADMYRDLQDTYR